MWELVWHERHEDHIAHHGVTPAEVEQALADPRALHRRTSSTTKSEQTVTRYVVLAATDAGRVLAVIVEPIGADLAVCVTARTATDRERRRYRARTK